MVPFERAFVISYRLSIAVVKVEVCSRWGSGRDIVGVKRRGGEGVSLPPQGVPLPIRLWGCEISSGVRGRAPAEKVWCILFVIEPVKEKFNLFIDFLTNKPTVVRNS